MLRYYIYQNTGSGSGNSATLALAKNKAKRLAKTDKNKTAFILDRKTTQTIGSVSIGAKGKAIFKK